MTTPVGRAVAFAALAAGIAAGTVGVGWVAVPAVAALFALLAAGRARFVAVGAGLAAAVAWGVLLALDAAAARFGALAAALEGAMQLPAAGIVLVTLVFPFVLAWSAATLGDVLGHALSRRSPTR